MAWEVRCSVTPTPILRWRSTPACRLPFMALSIVHALSGAAAAVVGKSAVTVCCDVPHDEPPASSTTDEPGIFSWATAFEQDKSGEPEIGGSCEPGACHGTFMALGWSQPFWEFGSPACMGKADTPSSIAFDQTKNHQQGRETALTGVRCAEEEAFAKIKQCIGSCLPPPECDDFVGRKRCECIIASPSVVKCTNGCRFNTTSTLCDAAALLTPEVAAQRGTAIAMIPRSLDGSATAVSGSTEKKTVASCSAACTAANCTAWMVRYPLVFIWVCARSSSDHFGQSFLALISLPESGPTRARPLASAVRVPRAALWSVQGPQQIKSVEPGAHASLGSLRCVCPATRQQRQVPVPCTTG